MAEIKGGTKKCEYMLSNGAIDAVAAKTEECLEKMGYERGNITSIRLSVEEYLLRWQERFGEEAGFAFSIGKRYGRPYLLLELKGEEADPIKADDEGMDWSNRILSGLGLRPSYTYSRGKNQVRLELKKRKSSTLSRILAAVVLAVVFGFLGRLIFPPEVLSTAADDYLSLISDKFFGLLRMVAGPLIFLSVVGGIGGIEDTATLGKFGKRTLMSFLATDFVLAVICAAAIPFVFSVPIAEAAGGGDRLMQIIKMLLDILPENIIDPFLTGNSMQIIVLAAAMGIAMMLLGKKTAGLFCVIDQINLVVKKIMQWIGALMPLLIFTVLLENLWSDKGKVLATAWQPMLLHVAVTSVYVVLCLCRFAFRLRMSPILLMKKLAPVTAVGFATASSAAAFGELNACCIKKLGVDEKAARFSVPFGMILSMAGCVSNLTIMAMYAVGIFGVEVSLMTLIVSAGITTMLAVTTPPVPGGLLASYAILFAHFGIPDDALAIAMTLSVFMDFVDTAVNVSLIPPVIAASAESSGMLDRKALLSDSEK